ncbi:NAD(P)-binding domain-containing protein, partial [Streptomyces sp. NPDC059556]|uniref:NAD(P)-binding domain-containing protein n=1 Tax=Streptomyces sp. NPDC059556 TaxID=3346863 RepID=UPI00367B6798
MGRALAGAFLRAGHPTTVWNRTSSKADALVAEGARLAPSIGAALDASPLTVLCLTDYDAVHELLGADDLKLDGTTLVNLTSGDSAQARARGGGGGARRGPGPDGGRPGGAPAGGRAPGRGRA